MNILNAIANMRGPFGNMQAIMQQAQQLQQAMQNPQRLVQQYFSDVPSDMQNDPDKIVQYLIDSGRITRQQINQIQQMLPRR